MSRIKLALVALVVSLVWAAGACESLTEVNENPNAPSDVTAGLLLPNAIRLAVEDVYGTGQYFSHTGIWPQQIVQIQYPDEEEGLIRPARMEIYWTDFYADELMNIQTVLHKGVESGDANVEAVGRIWKTWIFHIVTDMWGDVPYSEAHYGADNTTPAYNRQADIYAGMLADLTTAAGMLQNPDASDFGGGDLIYGSDFEAWRRFANSLRMRLAMRLSEVDAATARTEFAAAYAAGGFQSNADNATLNWPGSPYENPFYENRVIDARDDHGISATLLDTLVSLADPRLPLYAEPAASDGEYRGHHNGMQTIPVGTSLDDFSRIGDFWRFDGAATPTMIMSYAEVLFLQAEAAWRGWTAGAPATLYSEAIRASMNPYPVGPSDTEIDDYLAQPVVAYDGTLEQILLQKWIALWMNGPEAWSDNRRTDLPALVPGPDLILSRIPVRLMYPDTEQSLNLANLNAALAQQGMTSIDLVTPVWWDVN